MAGRGTGAAGVAGGGTGTGGSAVLPVPTTLRADADAFALSSATRVVVADDPDAVAVGTLWAQALVAAGGRDVGLDVAGGTAPGGRTAPGSVALVLDEDVPADGRYRLLVESRRITVRAGSRDGLLHALATVRQLLRRGPAGTVVVPAVDVEDGPVLPWRGVALDLRAGVPDLATLLPVVDLLALYKLDVLHLRLPGRPGAVAAGEWSTLVAAADARGVSVVPEVPEVPEASGDDVEPGAAGAGSAWVHAGEPGPGLGERLATLVADGCGVVVRLPAAGRATGVDPLPDGTVVELSVPAPGAPAVPTAPATLPAGTAGAVVRVPLVGREWEAFLAWDPLRAAAAAGVGGELVGVVGALPGPAPQDLRGLTAALLPALAPFAALAWDPAAAMDAADLRRRLAAHPAVWRRAGLPVGPSRGPEAGGPARA